MQEGRRAGRSEDFPFAVDDANANANANAFDADAEDDGPNIDEEVKLSGRERCARKFAIRRAIERHMERKALDDDLDYLDFDLDD